MTRFSLLAGIGISALTISNVVYAQTATWVGNGTPGDWNSSSNWQSGTAPTGPVALIIQAGGNGGPVFNAAAVSTSGSAFTKLELQTNAQMFIEANFSITGVSGTDLSVAAGALLEVDGAQLQLNASSGAAAVNGTVELVSGSSEMRIAQSAQFTGSGKIELSNVTSRIFIVPGVTLTNATSIEGLGDIASDFDIFFGNGTLENDGVVVANKNGDLVLGQDLVLVGDGSWHAAGINATLLFLENAAVGGDFLADNQGTIEIGSNVTIDTTGDARVEEDSEILLGSAATMEVDDLTGEDGGLVSACGAEFIVLDSAPANFPTPSLNDNRYLFDGTDTGDVTDDCPKD